MEGLIGRSPEPNPDPKKNRMPSGASFHWVRATFGRPPPADADDIVVQMYARAYVWYVISRALFADGSGRTCPWMWLKALSGWDTNWSWGSAALAYLYRQVTNWVCFCI